ncbi:MAG: 3-deoxy-manno-octulosonate cytidylyltransferase [Rickettsiales bacterium]
MRSVILIPARYASTRLPGKPLADICGKPMIVHVWERAIRAEIGEVWVATDHLDIKKAVEKEGGHAVMTDSDLPSGSDRIWQALQSVDAKAHYDTIINLQGDLPTIDQAIIQDVLKPLEDNAVDIATLVAEIHKKSEENDPAVVKPVISWADASRLQGKALYFSRSRIPYGEGALYHHIGIYAYRRHALERFVSLPPSPLETREKLEQLRALENGMRIDVRNVKTVPFGVDTPEQLEQARSMLS